MSKTTTVTNEKNGIDNLDDATASRFLAELDARNRYLNDTFVFCAPGRRFVRIGHGHGSGLSVVCFVERSTGLVFKAKSWKAAGRSTGETVWDLANGAAA